MTRLINQLEKDEKRDSHAERAHAPNNRGGLFSEKVRIFLVCFVGIFVFYIIFGILQERITKKEYGDNEKFQFTFTLVLVQCIVNATFAKIALMLRQPSVDTSPNHYYMAMAFSYVSAMVASSDALRFVSYPTQALGKSIKPIPIMILGVFLAKKRYTIKKYFFVTVIVIGVALFMYKPPKDNSAKADRGFSVGYGELLLMISLFMDGFTGGIQDRIRGRFKTNTYNMMLMNNFWSVVYLGIGTILTGELRSFVKFAGKFPSVLLELMALALSGAIGQTFIYTTVTQIGPLTCSIITTTRKFFTILCSVIVFGHPLSTLQWFGTGMVFTGLALDALYGKSPKEPAKS